MNTAHYKPPWADTSIVGIAGSSGSGKTSLAVEIVGSLNLPWVVILSMVETATLLCIDAGTIDCSLQGPSNR